ncbi:copper resistance protein CopC [Spirillospora sp. NPDC047279]|uniref:copper resistance CopC family protein n=1 Tax=Spirillospora sp. NPDC047279 TaxID=3155478 RepID=UPI0033E0BDAD
MPTSLRMPARRAGIVAALVALFAAIFVSPAHAHTRLVSSTPGKDATAGGVAQVDLVFSDKISVAKVLVKDDKGKEFQSGEATRAGTKVTQKLNGMLPAGTYTVSYAVVGEDGHRIEKSDLTFTATAETAEGTGEKIAGAEETGGPQAAGMATTAEPMKDGTEPAKADEESGGGTILIMVVVGVLIGIGIGVGIVFRAKRKHGAASGSE